MVENVTNAWKELASKIRGTTCFINYDRLMTYNYSISFSYKLQMIITFKRKHLGHYIES